MKIKAIGALLVCLCVIAFFSTCDTGSNDNNNSIKIVKVTPRALLATDDRDESARIAAGGANDFAFRLSALLAAEAGSENFVCSPYSVWMPLAALVNATNPQVKGDLLTALGAAGITAADINRAASRMLYDMTNLSNKESKDYHNPLKITNAIFVRNNVTLRKDFAQIFMDYYRGSSINVDFSSRDAVDAINRWASENTNGLIKNVVQELDPQTVAAIANAIYFSDRWGWEFSPSQTKEDIFYSPDGESAAFYMLREGDEQWYYEDERVQAIPLRFLKNGGMYIILPRDGNAAGLLSSMTTEYFNEIRRDSYLGKGKLLLPKFSIENDIKGLKDALIALGVPLFDKFLDPITGLIEEDIPLYLTDAIQKATIKVDEKGTTAAAVTVLPIGATSAGPQPTQPFEMICNRPFVFILYEDTHDGGDQVLFTGMVNKP